MHSYFMINLVYQSFKCRALPTELRDRTRYSQFFLGDFNLKSISLLFHNTNIMSFFETSKFFSEKIIIFFFIKQHPCIMTGSYQLGQSMHQL